MTSLAFVHVITSFRQVTHFHLLPRLFLNCKEKNVYWQWGQNLTLMLCGWTPYSVKELGEGLGTALRR